MSDRRELHTLVDHVRDSDVTSAKEYLRTLIDPFDLALLTAEPEDEPLTASERAALDEAKLRRWRGAPSLAHEDVLQDLGFSESDLR